MEDTMKIFRKALIITVIMTTILAGNGEKVTSISKKFSVRQPTKIALFVKDITDDYLIYISKYLKDKQEESNGKVEVAFYDSKLSRDIEKENMDRVIKEGVNLMVVDMADARNIQEVINKAKENNIPIIIFNREPLTLDAIKSYDKALFIGLDSKQAGALQGKLLVDEWNRNKQAIDKNRDNIMQYVMLQGERYNKVPIDRTKYSVLTIEQAGIKTEQLALIIAEWNKELAKNAIESLFLKYGDKIEVIIANDDSMAIGAIEALQVFGYNKGDKTRVIPVVGIDAVPETTELIAKGIMLGSIPQDFSEMAEAIYTTGMNLINNKSAIEGTEYKFDDTGVAIRFPYKDYIKYYE
jgi:methyl-galactoside transport system substrate-binding protein